MLQFRNFVALHVQQILNTFHTTGNNHYCEVAKGLVTNYGEGGATKREGGHMKFYPYEKGGRKKFWPF